MNSRLKKRFLYIDSIKPFLQSRIDNRSFEAIRNKTLITALIMPILFVAVLSTTSIQRRIPIQSTVALSTLIALTILQIYSTVNWHTILLRKRRRWKRLMISTLFAKTTIWSFFTCYLILVYEIGWPTYVMTILTFVIGTIETPILAPNFNILTKYLTVLFGPLLLTNAFIITGLKGTTLGLFTLILFASLIAIGKHLNKEFWSSANEHTRLTAIINAFPGTLSWVTRDLKYIGVNEKLANLWKLKPEQFVGKDVGFSSGKSELRNFIQDLFSNTGQSLAKGEIRHIVNEPNEDVPSKYLIIAQKYNDNTEAVVVGIDLTEKSDRV